MPGEESNPAPGPQGFGSCCGELKDAMSGEEFEPLITVGDDGVLYMSVGLIDLEQEDDPGMVDHPLFFCPFCGAKQQTVEEVRAKTGGENGVDDDEAK
jgi:hypothetical protein